MPKTRLAWSDMDQAFKLYELFRSEWYEALKVHHENLHKYLTFAVTLLGATVAGLLSIHGLGYKGAFVLVGPIANVLISLLAIRMCDRFYLGILERVSIIIKLESVLGLRDNSDLADSSTDDRPVFPNDKYLLPNRWVEGTQYDSTEEFIRKHLNSGVNLLARRVFLLIIIISGFLGIAVMLTVLVP